MWNHNTTSQNNPYVENGNSHYGVEVYNTTDMQYQNRIIHYGNHGDLGYAADGEEVLVQFYGVQQDGLYMYKLNGTGATTIIQNSDFGIDGHVSCRNINRPGWAYVTHSDSAQSGQLVAVKLDNTGVVEYFGHHFSSNTSYAQSPMATASPNGDKLCFKSDFGTGPNTHPSVAYSFIANLNSTLSIEDKQFVGIKAYPNPANDFIKIQSVENIKNINIYTVTGQIVKTIAALNSNDIKIDVKNFAKGLYIFKFSTDSETIAKKMIIK